MEWTEWTSCSRTCGPRGERHRSRSYIPGMFGAESQPEGDQRMVQKCSTTTMPGWPTCPGIATHGRWGDWSECSQTCFKEGSFPPMTQRRRECIEATFSSDPDLNNNIVTCATLQDVKETKTCQIPACQGASFNITS